MITEKLETPLFTIWIEYFPCETGDYSLIAKSKKNGQIFCKRDNDPSKLEDLMLRAAINIDEWIKHYAA